MPTKAFPNAIPGYDLAVKMPSISRTDKAVLLWHAPSGMALSYHLSRLCAMHHAVADEPLASCCTNTILTECSDVICWFFTAGQKESWYWRGQEIATLFIVCKKLSEKWSSGLARSLFIQHYLCQDLLVPSAKTDNQTLPHTKQRQATQHWHTIKS